MSNPPRMTETSYAVLGLLEKAEPATPYDLKQVAQLSVFNFWSVPHTQIYTECKRLAEAGLLEERREDNGRRRRFYSLTAAGRKKLDAWRAKPTDHLSEIRDPATLKLFFGADPVDLGRAQVEAHRRKLEELEMIYSGASELPTGMRLSLELGIGIQRECIRFWSRLAEGEGKAGG
jgi:DNA-binding PadR family transcriptional regulator